MHLVASAGSNVTQVTLMDWGNAIIRTITRDAEGRVTALAGDLHLAGDFKKTKKKLTWLSAFVTRQRAPHARARRLAD